MNLEGRLLGNRYEIIEKIGNGGMATVYKARCNVLNRYVAIKILRDEFTTDSEFIRRFNTEAQAAASLTHPNIVSIYDVGNEGDLYYIVMELIQGKTLKEIITEDGALTWKWSVNIAIQIASALEAAHRNNIVHRDIKPHNIIITEEGIAKVTDFGIAKAVSNSTITAFGTTIGSVHYFSPEHARGGYTDAKSDLYSLGVVMYEMLTGKVPFDADTPVSVALKHMQEDPIEPIELNPLIPASVNRIIMKAMQKDVNLRYSSATEMLRDLHKALKDPNGDFVALNKVPNDFPTQTIPNIYDKSLEDKIKEKDEENARDGKKKKKKNKFLQYLDEHKGVKIFTFILGGLLLFALVMGITYFATNALRPKDVQIPDLVGMSTEEAQKKLKELKLEYKVGSEEFSEEVPKDYIISQDPGYIENYTIKQKSTVTVVVSKGPEIVKVPKLTGMSETEAVSALEALGLEVDKSYETSSKVEEGYIIKQDPKDGAEVNASSTVKITISKGTGIKTVTVPNLIGKTEAEAKQAITNAGLTLNTVKYEEDSTKTDGAVIKQDVEAGKKVDENTPITITVNKIPQIKKGTVNINVKALTGYTPSKDENGVTTEPKQVQLKVVVNNDTVYKQTQREDAGNVSVGVEGIGTVTIKVYIDDVLKNSSQLDLNEVNPVLNIG